MHAPIQTLVRNTNLFYRYCDYVHTGDRKHADLRSCLQDVDAQHLSGFLSWVCDPRRLGVKGQRRLGIKYASSLETFWK